MEGMKDGRRIFLFCFYILRTVWLHTFVLPFLDYPFFFLFFFFRGPTKNAVAVTLREVGRGGVIDSDD
jgi:hypothetical protein